jgi:hypothetical protein
MFAEIATSTSGFSLETMIFGGLGVTAVIVWPRLQSYRSAVGVQCAGAVAFAAYFALSGASTASASCILAIVQLLTAALVRDRRVVIGVSAVTLACLGLIDAWTWSGIPTVLASVGCLVSTLARVQVSTHRMKIWFLVAAPFWLAHNVLTVSLFALVVDAVSIASNGSSIARSRGAAGDIAFRWPPLFVREICRIAEEFQEAARMCVSSSYLPRLTAS